MLNGPDLRQVHKRIIDAVSGDDAEALNALIAADLVDHNPVPDQPRAGKISWCGCTACIRLLPT